jgi:hypothetical protein
MTNLVTDEMLMALADGEIDRETAAALMRQMDADPELKQRFATFRDTRTLAKAAFAGALEEPVPPRLVRAAGDPPAEPRKRDWTRFWFPLGAAVAASVAGLIVGLAIPARVSPPSPHAIGAEIAEVLDNSQSGETRPLGGGGRVLVTGTYLTPEGACRSFEVTPGAAGNVWHDVACRRTGSAGWELEMAIAGHPGSDAFVPASDRIAASIADALDALGAGEALDPAAELRLREHGWQNDSSQAE